MDVCYCNVFKKGHHLNIIHNLDRPFKEMMLGLESWIPIYMTGQISPYYLKDCKNNLYNHLNYVSGAVALTGECIKGHHDKGMYYLTTNKNEIKYYKEKSTISNLKKLAKEVIVLSGDNEVTTNIIAKELLIDKIYSNMSPQDKVNTIKDLNVNKNVLMIGDGINDSPALKTAAIGISVANGTDISNDAADVIMLTDDMDKIIDLLNLGTKTLKIIKQNLFWALFYNVCMIPLATGLLTLKLNPMIASLAMIFSSMTVVMNSLRLKK